MDPITASLLMGAGSAGSNAAGMMWQNDQSKEAVASMEDFQRHMSSTAHQREVQDLRAAGLNPILSALGSGSSTPQGAMPSINNPGEAISKGMDTALAVRGQNKDLEAKDAAIKNQNADTTNKAVMTELYKNQSMAAAKDVESKDMANNLFRQTMNDQVKKARKEGNYDEVNRAAGLLSVPAAAAKQLDDLKQKYFNNKGN